MPPNKTKDFLVVFSTGNGFFSVLSVSIDSQISIPDLCILSANHSKTTQAVAFTVHRDKHLLISRKNAHFIADILTLAGNGGFYVKS
jgi:hypothetical protein